MRCLAWVTLSTAMFATMFGCAIAGEQKFQSDYQVSYRDYLGKHTVTGQRLKPGKFLYNGDADKKLALATLEWQPYIGKDICRQGWVMQSTIALLHSIGYAAEVTFYPWARAMSTVESGKADILFPEYYIEPEAPSDVFGSTRRLDHLILSDVFGFGPIAFIKRRGFDMGHYHSLNSLVNESIGVVRGYQNTPEFDRLMDVGTFKVVEAVDDMQNLKLLLNNRVNLIIGDPKVIISDIKNSNASEADKKAILENIKVVEPIIDMNGLHFAIAKRSRFADKLPIELNQAISLFQKHGTFEEIKYQLDEHCEDN